MARAPEMTGSDASASRKWESDGGSIAGSPDIALPDGVIAITVTQYRVGPYIYTSLEDALAQHRRQLRTE